MPWKKLIVIKLFYKTLNHRAVLEKDGTFLGVSWQETRGFLNPNPQFP